MRLRNIPRAGRVLDECPLVIKDAVSCKGTWAGKVFQNTRPIHIEIGMGKGKFLIALARKNPEVNYIGIERYSSVLLRAVEKLIPQTDGSSPCPPPNLRFICMDAARIEEVFSSQEVSRIYLNFSDPWPKARHAGRRLTSPGYLDRYSRISRDDGQIEFKTDNQGLFAFSEEAVKNSGIWAICALTRDLHRDAAMNAENIMTEYEEKFSSMDNPICKLIARKTIS